MPYIKPSAELRNNYNEISRICHETNEPIFITRNGASDLVVLSDEAYENLSKNSNEKNIEKLIDEHMRKKYKDFEEFKSEIFKEISVALNEIKSGKGIKMSDLVAEMEAKYDVD